MSGTFQSYVDSLSGMAATIVNSPEGYKQRVIAPEDARFSVQKVGRLMPLDEFYTKSYGCATGYDGLRIGPTRVYRFSGNDLGFDYDVLVRTGNGMANFPYVADKIADVNPGFGNTKTGIKNFVVYSTERLSREIQERVFDAMEIDWVWATERHEIDKSGAEIYLDGRIIIL
ncbi:MAG: hypothetical protein V1870_05675 [Candidatus Aenigmatarchaeota archaeon]